MKLEEGIYGPVVAFNHCSGLGIGLMGESPMPLKVLYALAEHKLGVLGVCKASPLLAQLAWPIWRRCGTTGSPITLPQVLQRSVGWVPRLSKLFFPLLTGRLDTDRVEPCLSEQGRHRGALLALEGGHHCPRGSCCCSRDKPKVWDSQAGQGVWDTFVDCRGKQSWINHYKAHKNETENFSKKCTYKEPIAMKK